MKLINGDCLEVMKDIPDNSIDLIVTDPPYGTMNTDGGRRIGINGWDEEFEPNIIFSELLRVLRPNGKCVLFSQEPYTSKLITNAIPSLPFSYRAVWLKNTFGNCLGANKNMMGLFEDICIYSKLNLDFKKENPLRTIMKKYITKYGKDFLIDLFEKEGRYTSKASARVNCSYKFGFNKGNRIDLMDKKLFDYLSQTVDFEETHEELKQIYDDYNIKNPSVFNIWEGGKSKSNVLEYAKDKEGFHPTQKPVKLLEDLIKTFSNEGDIVLDFTMGSGSTGVACKNTNRDFIGIELDEKYFNIAKSRIELA